MSRFKPTSDYLSRIHTRLARGPYTWEDIAVTERVTVTTIKRWMRRFERDADTHDGMRMVGWTSLFTGERHVGTMEKTAILKTAILKETTMTERETEKRRALQNLKYLIPAESTAGNPFVWPYLEKLPVRVLNALADALSCAHDRGVKHIELNPEAPRSLARKARR